METEDLYISLYEHFSPTAEYLQADSPHRNILPETIIIAGLSFALAAFAKSFFGSLGKAAAETVIEEIKSGFNKTVETGDRDAMLDALELMGPYLKHLTEMTEDHRMVYQFAVASALGVRGYPQDVANETAAEVMASLVTAGKEQVI